MIAAGTVVPKPKLTIKFPSQKIDVTHVTPSFEVGQQWSGSLDGKRTSYAGNFKMGSGSCEFGTEGLILENEPEKKRRKMDRSMSIMASVSCNRGPEGLVLERPLDKRRKMDRSMTQQCSSILKILMNHPFSWVFSKPVDPLQLNIPDYFSIIKNPMDLGTIYSKLAKNTYLTIEEFEADVKLTFSNAVLYNPSSKDVHQFAVELNEIFESRWKSLEEKLIRDMAGRGKVSIEQLKDVSVPKQTYPKHKIHLYGNSSLPMKSKASEEKGVKMPLDARASSVSTSNCIFKHTCKASEQKGVKMPLGARASKFELPKSALNHESKLAVRNSQKGRYCGEHAYGSLVNAKPPLSVDACKCSSCGSINCQCILPIDSNHASSSERSLRGDLRVCSADAPKLDCQAKSTLSSQMSKSDPDSDGSVSALDDYYACPSYQIRAPTSDADFAKGLFTPCFDTQMSPKKALRAAMLRSRFADTILKAQQKTSFEHAGTFNPVKMQLGKAKWERRKREEKAKIEAQIKAKEAAAKTERKRQWERERESSRLAFEKMVKTADIECNLEHFKELELLSGGSLDCYPCCKNGCEKLTGGGLLSSRRCRNPLHRLGLFLKNEYLEDEDEEAVLNEGAEEGEILS